MTTEIVIGISTLAGLVIGIWIGWMMHHIAVVEEVKKELLVFNRDIALSFEAVHSRIDCIVGLPKTIEEVLLKDIGKVPLTESKIVTTNN